MTVSVTRQEVVAGFNQWLWRHPVRHSMVLFLLLVIVVCGAIAFFIMVGAVQFAHNDTKQLWLEIQFQVLNAIFTLACLLDQPMRVRGLLFGGALLWHHRRHARLIAAAAAVAATPDGTCKNSTEMSDMTASTLDPESSPAADSADSDARVRRAVKCCTVYRDALLHYFPWLWVDSALPPPATIAQSSSISPETSTTIAAPLPDSAVTAADNDIAAQPPTSSYQLAPPVTKLNHFVTAMVLLNISTAGQAVMTCLMWFVHPSQVRPQIPIAIALPISFLTNAAAMLWVGLQLRRWQVWKRAAQPPRPLQ